MNEKTVYELLNFIQLHSTEFEVIQVRLEQCSQAIKRAKQLQRWDLVMELVNALSYHFEISPSSVNVKERSQGQTAVVMRDLWEQGRWFAMEGLLAAKQVGNKEKELGFLVDLSRLSGYLNDFVIALDYLKQELRLVRPDMKWHTARELHKLGNRASEFGDFLAARACYQMSLDVLQELNNKYGMAEELAFMAANELSQIEKGTEAGRQFSDDLRIVIDSLWELSETLRREAKLSQAKSTHSQTSSMVDNVNQPTVDPTYRRLQDVLVKLNSLT